MDNAKSPSKIVIIDYKSGNLQSVFNALESIKNSSDTIQISNIPNDLESATHIILPGVGAFGDCISSLRAIKGMVEALKLQIMINKKPFLGICVGMQLLADFGLEYGNHSGLGFISGNVVGIDNLDNQLKIPHIGWNNIDIKKPHPILEGIKNGEHFYFVHSFKFIPKDQNDVVAIIEYGEETVAILAKENIIATQFHPEKSSDAGLLMLKNFIQT